METVYCDCESEATEPNAFPPPILAEVAVTIMQLSSNRSLGMDNVEAEPRKCGRDELHKYVHTLI